MFDMDKRRRWREKGVEPVEATPMVKKASTTRRVGERSRSTGNVAAGCKGVGDIAGGSKRARLMSDSLTQAITCGIVNGILMVPILVGFTTIIFRDSAFAPFLPRLLKLVAFSGAVHAAGITIFSDLKFAIGSVQDAGLIFLSSIASSVVAYSKEQGLDDHAMMSNACVILCSCTALLGLSLVLIGHLRLASLVQYLPMPVIGGYLAFIGYFCGQAGMAFATGLEITDIRTLSKLASREGLVFVSPAVAGGVVMYLLVRRFPSSRTLPLLMVGFIASFFGILAFTGTTLEEARSLGWIGAASPMLPLNEAWGYFDLRDVRWDILGRVFPTMSVMTLVVAFSSCLDVAAIEMEMGSPLDFNRELQTVGWSNVFSGMSGGFSGSYIFSLTIFNLRSGVESRLSGAITSILILGMSASPLNIISYLPKAFFGAVLIFIAVDLMVEWLWEARRRMVQAEYGICLITFVMIHAIGVAAGMFAGLVLAALSFTITYAQTPKVMGARVKGSNVMRTFEERMILQAHSQQTVILELQGYIFFGSAVKILSDVKKRIVWGSIGSEGVNDSVGPRAGDSEKWLEKLRQLPVLRPDTSAELGPGEARGEGMTTVVGPSLRLQRQHSATVGDIRSPLFSRSGSMTGSFKPSGVKTGSWWSVAFTNRDGTPSAQRSARVFARSKAGAGTSLEAGEVDEEYGPEPSSILDPVGLKVNVSESSVDRRVHSRMGSERQGHVSGGRSVSNGVNTDSVTSLEGSDYGALEDDVAEREAGGSGMGKGTRDPRHQRWSSRSLMPSGEGKTGTDQAATEAYMSLWSTASAEEGAVDLYRLPSMSQLPLSEQRTHRLILDFSRVVGIDATAARSCFLMLKIVLVKSGVGVVFAGARKSVLDLLRAHEVIGDEDPTFESLDTALEWSEEMTLKERRDAVLQSVKKRGMAPPPPSPTTSSLSAPRVPQDVLDETAQGITPSQWRRDHRRILSSSSSSTVRPPPLSAGRDGDLRGQPDSCLDAKGSVPAGGEDPGAASLLPSEAAAFLGDNEEYYARVGLQRRISSGFEIVDELPELLSHGSLKSILEDYLEVDRRESTSDVQCTLEDASLFFKTKHFAARTVLLEEGTASEELNFIGSGSVELQIPGEPQGQRVLKICTGGTFGAMGFYLQTPQPFRALAIEDCHLYTLDREGMATMQRQKPELCILIQKALLKSICLTASMSLETRDLMEVEDRRPPRLRCFTG